MAVVGNIVEGTITSVMAFGAFVDLGSNESGLVHISELSNEYVKDINTFVKKGDRVKVKIIRVDENGKISLSMKQAEQKQERVKKQKPQRSSARPDSFDWSARQTEELSFEDKLSRFKHESEEKIRDTKRRMENKRSGGYSRKGY
ncbi:MAG: S1 RNA-binding domain-containing protein [Oscillospiraceae bacterium]|nr:S1 RNA-binding domain-containing protein [Oscillospiraceae bacterium]